MEEKNKGLNINIEHYTGEKPIEVVYRLGDAAQAQQPLATKAPEKISVSGTISTPYEWLSKRIDTVDQKRANVVVNREKMTIQLTVNEDDYYNKTRSLVRLKFLKHLRSSVLMMVKRAGSLPN